MDIEKFLTYIKSNRQTFLGTPGTIQCNFIEYKNVYRRLPHWHGHFSWGPVNKYRYIKSLKTEKETKYLRILIMDFTLIKITEKAGMVAVA